MHPAALHVLGERTHTPQRRLSTQVCLRSGSSEEKRTERLKGFLRDSPGVTVESGMGSPVSASCSESSLLSSQYQRALA